MLILHGIQGTLLSFISVDNAFRYLIGLESGLQEYDAPPEARACMIDADLLTIAGSRLHNSGIPPLAVSRPIHNGRAEPLGVFISTLHL